ncbi:Urb2 domain-containing protein [Mycena chlorophos]|uniref:Urb2 domain-containing protein n=1 Tax=Mycena chlorophos TaxID=658473 RepID=A0A8H6TU41_MYCCL|nr:Urb2 domain-containing protein [Mycena chlorophos]
MSGSLAHVLKTSSAVHAVAIAYHQNTLPNGHQPTAEWLLTRLLKDQNRQNPASSNPIVDVEYWTLLADVLSVQSTAQKHWLLPLLNRVPVAPILASLFELCQTLEQDVSDALGEVASRCFMRFWPLAVPRISTEALLECFGAFLRVEHAGDGLAQMGLSITESLRHSVANSTNKKKIAAIFIQTHLNDWLVMISDSKSQEALYAVGIEILFNADTLRQAHDENHPLVVALRSIPQDIVHPTISRLFASLVASTKKHRGALFGQSSNTGHATHSVTDSLRAAVFTFFDSCTSILAASAPTSATWEARNALLAVIRDENIFVTGYLDGQLSLQSLLPPIISTFTEVEPQHVTLAVTCLSTLVQIDHDLVLKDIPRILPALLVISEPTPAILDFLNLLLEYHIKTRTVQTHLETLFKSFENLSPRPNSIAEYRALCCGMFLHPTHLERLVRATETFLTQSQIAPTLQFITTSLQTLWSNLSAAKSDTLAATFALSCQLAAVVLPALPLRSQELRSSLADWKDGFVSSTASKSLKAVRKNTGDWEEQVVCAALLRLAYSLGLPQSEKLWERIHVLLEDLNIELELLLEMFRLSLSWAYDSDISATRALLDGILTRLVARCDLDILSMLVERWLPTFDALASDQQLENLVEILFRLQQDDDGRLLLLNSLTSAEIWELPRLRVALLTFADVTTARLKDLPSAARRDAASSIYRILLLFPVETLSRSARSDITTRAIETDISLLKSECPELRLFLERVSLYIGSIEQPTATLARYLNHLTADAPSNPTVLSLIETLLRSLTRLSDTTSVDAVVQLIRSLDASDSQTALLSRVTRVVMASDPPPPMRAELEHLYRRLYSALSARVNNIPDRALLDLWLQARLLGHQLHIGEQTPSSENPSVIEPLGLDLPLMGRRFCASISTQDSTSNAAFAVLAHELSSIPAPQRSQHLGFVFAAYVSFSRAMTLEDGAGLDRLVSESVRGLEPDAFSSLASLTMECLSNAESTEDLPSVVHLSALLLSSHPPGKKFVTACLVAFADRPTYTSGPRELRMEVLGLVRHACSEHPASLRALDLGNIWLILSKLLASSKSHDPTTSTDMFHGIAHVVGALIRSRRDLVMLALPNLGIVLQRLVTAIRRPRPLLGAKQAALVADLLPQWIDPATALSIDEAKGLARLLEALVIKTTVRAQSDASQKAESLSRPFSKHSAYVLKAYIDAMNDPLCFLPSDIRRELRPGLFALCSMISEHSRDALMMASLDSGGKMILKSLWAEYERQKYVGKG